MLRYAITPGSFVRWPDQSALAALKRQAAALADDGVDFLLVREKRLPAGALVELCRGLAGHRGRMRLLVSSRPDVALAAGLDGVHLSATPGELTPGQVRRLLPAAFVSVSCHTLAELRQAHENGADAALFGPVFGKQIGGMEVTPGLGLARLREACVVAGTLPVFALGGVEKRSAAACMAAGAAGIAGIRMFA